MDKYKITPCGRGLTGMSFPPALLVLNGKAFEGYL